MEEREATPSVPAPLNQQQPTDYVFYKDYPAGFRFDPYDEELILHYLKPKIDGTELPLNLMHDVNIYKHNPDDLILDKKHKPQGKNTWYFFTSRDKKYKNGTRPSRSAGSGYWKATGADKTIRDENGNKIGYRKALVFYLGRPPKGDKTHWIMHEFRVEGPPKRKKIDPTTSTEDTSMRLDDYVLCRIYKKEERRGKDKTPSKKVARKGGAKKHSKAEPSLIKEEENLHLVDEPQPPINNVVQGNGYPPPKSKAARSVRTRRVLPPLDEKNSYMSHTDTSTSTSTSTNTNTNTNSNFGVNGNCGRAEIEAFVNNPSNTVNNWNKDVNPDIYYDNIFEEQPLHLESMFPTTSTSSLPPPLPLSDYTNFHGTSSTATMMDYNFLTPQDPLTQNQFMFTLSSSNSTMFGPSTSSPSTFADTGVDSSDLYAMISSVRQ